VLGCACLHRAVKVHYSAGVRVEVCNRGILCSRTISKVGNQLEILLDSGELLEYVHTEEMSKIFEGQAR
jgi:hypothetical protein